MATSKNRIDVEFLPKGLHDIGRLGMSGRIRQALERVDENEYDAILLGYALCSGGVVGLEARAIPLVIPRAHDCITLFLGDRKKYNNYFFANPGTYFKTTGWIERGEHLSQAFPSTLFPSTPSPENSASNLAKDMSLEQMIQRYGEENGRYLWDQLTGMTHYSKLAFIETGLEPDDWHARHAQRQAAERGWHYEKLDGDLSILRRLLDGPWDNDFLVVPPGHRIEFSYTEDLVQAVPTS